MALKRVNMNLSEDLIEKIDLYAEKMGINRSAAISVLISTQLQQYETIGLLKTFADVVETENHSGV